MTKAPKILVKTIDGQPTNIFENHENKNLLILFYNNNCLGCTGRAIPLAYKAMQEFSEIQVVAIHSNFGKSATKEEILEIFTSKELPFPIYIDENHKIFDLYQCEGTPHWVIINRNQQVVKSFFGSQEISQTRLWYSLNELTQFDH